jgi:hypothetical protein
MVAEGVICCTDYSLVRPYPGKGRIPMDWYWQAMEAIGTVVGAFLVVGTIILTWRQARGQLREMKRQRQAQLAAEVLLQLRSPEARSALHNIYHGVTLGTPFDQIERELHSDIAFIVDKLDFLGILAAGEFIDEDLAMKVTRASALRFWWKLREYMIWQRQQKRGGYYARWTEHYAARSLKYELEKLHPEERTMLEGKCMVDELQANRKPLEYQCKAAAL